MVTWASSTDTSWRHTMSDLALSIGHGSEPCDTHAEDHVWYLAQVPLCGDTDSGRLMMTWLHVGDF
eukprot:333806-Amphidinium_carterae.1